MSKTSAIQRIEALNGWMAQMERDGKTFNRHKKTVKNKEEEDDSYVPKEE